MNIPKSDKSEVFWGENLEGGMNMRCTKDITDDQWILSVLPLHRRMGNSDGRHSKHTNPVIDMGNGSQYYASYHTSNEKLQEKYNICM